MSRIPHYGRRFSRPAAEAAPVVVQAPAPAPAPDAPDWRSLGWPQMRSLAASVTDEPIRNRETAERVLAAKFG